MSTKETLKSVKLEYSLFQEKVKETMTALRFPATRKVAVVSAADDQGKLNGMTIVELLTMVNMAKTTGERVVLDTRYNRKDLIINLEKVPTVDTTFVGVKGLK